jgi:hypothetical protein
MAVLLRAGARIDTRSADGRTFLHAAQKLSPDAIALLASAPAEQLRALGRRPPGASPDGRAPQPSLLELARQRGTRRWRHCCAPTAPTAANRMQSCRRARPRHTKLQTMVCLFQFQLWGPIKSH